MTLKRTNNGNRLSDERKNVGQYVGLELSYKQTLSPEDIEFITIGLTKPEETSKEFMKLHLRIENKRRHTQVFNCT